MLITLILCANFVLICLLLFKRTPTPDKRVEQAEHDEEDFIHGSEEVQEVNRSFDERIMQLKEEIALTRTAPPPVGVEAEELHPLVKNLPHDTVYVTAKPNHEYAD